MFSQSKKKENESNVITPETKSEYNEGYIRGKVESAKYYKSKPRRENHDRLPPGQQLIGARFPVLDLGFKPNFDPKKWKLSVHGLVQNPQEFSYEQFLKLPKAVTTADFHCVTHWSKFDVEWSGVRFVDLLEIVKPLPEAEYVITECADGYTTNNALDEFLDENVLLAYELDGLPIPREHGWPVRVIIPHLYAWKGGKFVTGLCFQAEDELGFWEERGYHNHADPWKEERYSED